MDDQPWEIRIAIHHRPPHLLYARLVLGCQWLVSMLGMGSYVTVWPDETLATDDDLNGLRDRLDEHDPWAP